MRFEFQLEASGTRSKVKDKGLLGQQIKRLRLKMRLSQSEFGNLLDTSAMSVSRWERDINLPDARELIRFGVLAQNSGLNGWRYWRLAGVTEADAHTMLKLKARRVSAAQL